MAGLAQVLVLIICWLTIGRSCFEETSLWLLVPSSTSSPLVVVGAKQTQEMTWYPTDRILLSWEKHSDFYFSLEIALSLTEGY